MLFFIKTLIFITLYAHFMKKSTRNNLLIALIYCLVLLGTVYMGKQLLEKTVSLDENFEDFKDPEQQKAADIAHIIKKKYVDEINTDSLMYLPLDSMLHQLDPHSTYLPPLTASEQSESLSGGFQGIGVEYLILNDTLLVTNIVNGGPAAKAGLKRGDKILMIDSVKVSGMNLPQNAVMGRIKGKENTLVKLKILRSNLMNPLLLNVRRERVAVSSIESAFMLNAETGYVKIENFGAETDKDFVKEVDNLRAKGAKNLIVDLRDNGGGYLKSAVALVGHFFADKKLVTYTQGRHEARKDYYTIGNGEFDRLKLTVLINENTASAAEIFAGAIQDYNRGNIIGRRSFGKGLVQEQYIFEDGSAVNLTVARYYTPTGRSIQKPYNKGLQVYQNDLEERLNSGELTSDDGQIDTVKADKITPKGGIKPDIYVKLDTVGYNQFFMNLVKKRMLINFVYEILAERYNADYLKSTLNSFTISDKDYVDFLKYLEWQKIPIDVKQLVKSKPLIYKNLKLLLYKYHFGEDGYYKVNNLDDRMIKQAINTMNSK